jgi:hypothetical protein
VLIQISPETSKLAKGICCDLDIIWIWNIHRAGKERLACEWTDADLVESRATLRLVSPSIDYQDCNPTIASEVSALGGSNSKNGPTRPAPCFDPPWPHSGKDQEVDSQEWTAFW